MSPVRIGVVGMNYWGPNLARNFARMPEADLAWCCDLDAEILARHEPAYPTTRFTTRLDDLLEDDTLDAVVIATSVPTHAALAMRSLDAGKHTFVEKPLAPSVAQASELLELAEERDLCLMCGQTFLYSPPVTAVKQLLDSGELGQIFFISSSRVNLGLHQRDVSVIWDLGPHDFSILLHWLGEMPESITATGRDSIVEGIHDVAFVTMRFGSGVVVNVELSWLAPSKLRRTAIVASKKMVLYEDGSPEPVRVFDRGVIYRDPKTFGEYQLSYRTGDILSLQIPATEPLVAELGEFVRLVRSGQQCPNVALAHKVVMLAEAAEASLAGGGSAVEVNAPSAVAA